MTQADSGEGSSTTTCPLDCPDACKLVVTRRDQQIVKIDGSSDDPHTNGFICGKVRNYADHVYSTHRLKTPMRRSGAKGSGRFEPITWEEALATIAERIQLDRDRYGAESILPLCYGGSNGRLSQDALDARFFYRLGASRLDRTVCAAPSGAAYQALYGKMPGVSCLDYDESQLIIIWGNNPHASGIHQVPHIQNAQAKGAKLVVIDPRKTSLASRADHHLPIYPGSDLVVALAMIRWLDRNGYSDSKFIAEHVSGFEQLRERSEPWTVPRAAEVSRVPESSLEAVFQLYAESEPAVIRCGWGPERNRNGGSATAAILAIPAVANKFCRSGGFTMSNSGVWKLNQASIIQASPPATRRINMNLIGECLLGESDPPVATLFVYNCNPVATLPEQNKVIQGLQRDDLFTIVFDQVLTDTAMYADIVLPATTFLEHDDLRNGYGNTRMGRIEPMIAPVGQSRSNNEVFGELLDRLDLSEPEDVTSDSGLVKRVLGDRSFAELQRTGELAPGIGPRPVQMQVVFPATPSGRIELYPEPLVAASKAGLYQYIEEDAADDYPLAVISPATSKTVNSSLGYLVDQPMVATMHPRDAAEREINDGQSVRIFNASGEVIVAARVSDSVAPGVVSLPKGMWMRHSKNKRTSNALAPDTLSDIGEGACFNDTRVQVARLAGEDDRSASQATGV
ncbi:MAG: molybdopterin-dependent oxidoreductase [Planctomycetota bacterium]